MLPLILGLGENVCFVKKFNVALKGLRIRAMHEANTLLDILVDNSVIIPSLSGFEKMIYDQNVQKLQIVLFFAFCIASILNMVGVKSPSTPSTLPQVV